MNVFHGPSVSGAAGVRPADVVLQVGDRPVRTSAELLRAVAALAPQSGTRIVVQRGQQQLRLQRVALDAVVVGSGSSGTHGGMVAGFFGNNIKIPLIGIGVSRDPADQEPLVFKEAQAVDDLLGIGKIPREAVLAAFAAAPEEWPSHAWAYLPDIAEAVIAAQVPAMIGVPASIASFTRSMRTIASASPPTCVR